MTQLSPDIVRIQVAALQGLIQTFTAIIADYSTPIELIPGLKMAVKVLERTAAQFLKEIDDA